MLPVAEQRLDVKPGVGGQRQEPVIGPGTGSAGAEIVADIEGEGEARRPRDPRLRALVPEVTGAGQQVAELVVAGLVQTELFEPDVTGVVSRAPAPSRRAGQRPA